MSAVRGLVLIAPHVVVEDVTLEAIRETRSRFETTDLRDRLSRHHDDPEVAFRNWCEVWLDPAFVSWTLEPNAARVPARSCSCRAPRITAPWISSTGSRRMSGAPCGG